MAGTWSASAGSPARRRMGIVPADTRLPPRNDGVQPWAEHSAPTSGASSPGCRRAFAGMLDHADRQLARLVGFLERAGSATIR